MLWMVSFLQFSQLVFFIWRGEVRWIQKNNIIIIKNVKKFVFITEYSIRKKLYNNSLNNK